MPGMNFIHCKHDKPTHGIKMASRSVVTVNSKPQSGALIVRSAPGKIDRFYIDYR